MMFDPNTVGSTSTASYNSIYTSSTPNPVILPSGEKPNDIKCDCECHNESKLKTALEMAAIPITECVECRCWDRMKS